MITDAQVEAALAAAEFATNPHTRKWMRAALEAAEKAAWRPVSEMIDGEGLVLGSHKCRGGATIYETWDLKSLREERDKIASGMFDNSPHLVFFPEALRPLLLPPGDAK